MNTKLLLWLTACFVALGLGGLGGYLLGAGTPLVYDEWVCSDGEAPVMAKGDRPGDGNSCARVDKDLPEGQVFDPLGNRPLADCDRTGWRAIERTGRSGDQIECIPDTMGLPEGYRRLS